MAKSGKSKVLAGGAKATFLTKFISPRTIVISIVTILLLGGGVMTYQRYTATPAGQDYVSILEQATQNLDDGKYRAGLDMLRTIQDDKHAQQDYRFQLAMARAYMMTDNRDRAKDYAKQAAQIMKDKKISNEADIRLVAGILYGGYQDPSVYKRIQKEVEDFEAKKSKSTKLNDMKGSNQ